MPAATASSHHGEGPAESQARRNRYAGRAPPQADRQPAASSCTPVSPKVSRHVSARYVATATAAVAPSVK